jgi:2-oxoglutarate dehydrogenase E1 component
VILDLGANYVRPTPSGKKVALSLVANPSHLEAEDPIVLAETRALQHMENDVVTHNTAMGMLLHGDAAFVSQGVVYETMGMHTLPNYDRWNHSPDRQQPDWFHYRSPIRPLNSLS